MTKVFFGVLLGVSMSIALFSQEQVAPNRIDEQGRKQGPWKKFYESTKAVFYEGQFVDDKQVGEFRHYYKNGALRSVTNHKHPYAQATVYDQKGTVISQGRFKDKLKDSTWVFFNHKGALIQKVSYAQGKKNGVEETFFENGQLASRKIYINDVENGPFETYFKNGSKESIGHYLNGLFDDSIRYYYENGNTLLVGLYRLGIKEGKWWYYHESGKDKMWVVYREGKVVQEEFINGSFETYYGDGGLESVANYTEGLKDGEFIEYYPVKSVKVVPKTKENPYEPDDFMEVKEQQIKRIIHYKLGKLDGNLIEYNSDGTIRREEKYSDGNRVDK
jgi:antitoxin component YwqK of YwqJK toxin-antitoxin module